MKILTSAEMGEVDRRTAEEFGVPLAKLMERAGAAVARFCEEVYPSAKRVVVVCGRGNNGGDGLVAARYLKDAGCEVRVLLLPGSELKGEAAGAMERLRSGTAAEIQVREMREDTEPEEFGEALGWAELIVDAVVGTGFKPPLRGVAVTVREALAGIGTPVVAVDLPSGWDADSTAQHAGERGASAFRADAVVTFTAPKMAHVFGHLTEGRTFGPVAVAEIGSPAEAVLSAADLTWTGTSKAIAERPRDINSNKGKFGHVLLVGGSYGKAGAPSMSSLACLRTGAGLVTAAVPDGILNTVALVTPELMLMPLMEGVGQGVGSREEATEGRETQRLRTERQRTEGRETERFETERQGVEGGGIERWRVGDGAASVVNLEEGRLGRLMKGITVLAIGPGLSTDGEASAFARGLVEKTAAPVVIDADALNAFAGKTEFLRAASGRATGEVTRTVVLTPHPGEMGRLLGMTVKEVEADRIGLARRFATGHGVTLVLKGWRTLVAHPDGRVAVNTTGNPGMAKGGSGDILTGVVAAMLAQFPERVAEAVEAAVYLHGLAADLAIGGAGGMDEHTLLATDTVAHLSAAFRYRVRDESGFTWICGVRGGAR